MPKDRWSFSVIATWWIAIGCTGWCAPRWICAEPVFVSTPCAGANQANSLSSRKYLTSCPTDVSRTDREVVTLLSYCDFSSDREVVAPGPLAISLTTVAGQFMHRTYDSGH